MGKYGVKYRDLLRCWDGILQYANRKHVAFGNLCKSLYICPIANIDHKKSLRAFAHVNHIPHTVCVSGYITQIPINNILGILAHEFGHLLAIEYWGDYSENAADRSCKQWLNLDIKYSFPHAMQSLSNRDIKKLGLL
jgi:hypothetical protein